MNEPERYQCPFWVLALAVGALAIGVYTAPLFFFRPRCIYTPPRGNLPHRSVSVFSDADGSKKAEEADEAKEEPR